METRQNYLVIGSFVLLGTALVFMFALWLSGGKDERLQTYHMYFTESVNGLNVGSAVKYRGVEVGKVTVIDIDPRNSERIEVTADIAEDAPIKQDTIAMLKLQGITGLVYVELTGGSPQSKPLVANENDRDGVPVIRSKESSLSQVVTSLPEIADKFSRLGDQLLRLMDDKNIAAATETVQNMQQATTQLASLVQKTNEAMAHVNVSAENVEAITRNSRKDAEEAVEQARKAMEQLTNLLERTNKFSSAGYGELSTLLVELKKTARDVQGLSRELKEEPSKVIRPVKAGGVQVP